MRAIDKAEVPRDRWGRPVIDGHTYTRASTLARVLVDKEGLMQWKARMTALGLARSPDLIALASVTSVDDKDTLNTIVQQANDRARAGAARDVGTAIHQATMMLDSLEAEARLELMDELPGDVLQPALAYQGALERHSLEPLAGELFVVCREVQAAGTLDRVLRGPNRTVIADIKTANNLDQFKYSALEWSIQLAVYAHGMPWHHDAGFVSWRALGLPTPNLDRGLVIHIHQGSSEVRLYSIDLQAGWRAALLAAEALRMRTDRSILTVVPEKELAHG